MPKKNEKTPIVVSIINLKGGVGKTTVAALLARHAAAEGWNVLAVDLDPQSNLSQALMTENEYRDFMGSGEASIVELLNGYKPPSEQQTAPTELSVKDVLKQVGYNEDFHLIPSRFDFSDNLISSVKPDAQALARFISKRMKKKNLILIDCAPTESIITRTAYYASRHILVPVRTEFFSTIGFPLLQKSLEEFKSKNPTHAIGVCGVLINNSESTWTPRGPHHHNARNDICEQAERYNWPVMENEMFLSRGYPKLMSESFPSHTGNSRSEFRKIADEFLNMMELS